MKTSLVFIIKEHPFNPLVSLSRDDVWKAVTRWTRGGVCEYNLMFGDWKESYRLQSHQLFGVCFHTSVQERWLQLLPQKIPSWYIIHIVWHHWPVHCIKYSQNLIRVHHEMNWSFENLTPIRDVYPNFRFQHRPCLTTCKWYTPAVPPLYVSFMSSGDVLTRSRCLFETSLETTFNWLTFVCPFWALPVLTGLVSGRYLGKFVRHVPWFCLIWPGRAFLDVSKKSGHFWTFWQKHRAFLDFPLFVIHRVVIGHLHLGFLFPCISHGHQFCD